MKQWLGKRRIDVARIDIKNEGDIENDLRLYVINNADCKIESPDWCSRNKKGKGYVLHTYVRHIVIDIACINQGRLSIRLRSEDFRRNGERLAIYADYTKLMVNGDTVFCESKSCCHDGSYVFSKNVIDEEVVRLEVFWEAHEYTKKELEKLGGREFLELIESPACMIRSKADFRKCIDYMDGGEENIYLLDDEGKYDWWSICGKNLKLTCNSNGEPQFNLTHLPPICLNDSIDEVADELLYEVCTYVN